MKLKRIVTSISASLDDLINKVENHQAAADCAIAELGRTAAAIRQQLQAATNQQHNLKQSLARTAGDIELWQQRAKDSAQTDKEKALRCVQALGRSRSQAQTLAQQLEQANALVHQLQTYMNDVEARLVELHHKKAALRARQAHNQAASAFNEVLAQVPAGDVFSRWEQTIATEEYARGLHVGCADDLAQEFAEAETRQALECELECLLQSAEQEGEK